LIILQLTEKYNNKDPLFGLIILYSFDYLHLTHKCVSQFLKCGSISETDLLNLKNTINENN
jgi:hypothetical protein